MSSVPRRTFDIESSVSELKPSDKVKSWIDQIDDPVVLYEYANRPKTPDSDQEQYGPSTDPSIQGRGLSPSSQRSPRRRPFAINSIASQGGRDTTKSVVTCISRSHVPSTPSRTSKRPASAAPQNAKAPSSRPTPKTLSKKVKAQDTLTTPQRINPEPINLEDIEDDDSPLAAPRKWSQSSYPSPSILSDHSSPPPFLIRPGHHTPVPVRFRKTGTATAADPQAGPSTPTRRHRPVIKIESDSDSDSEPEPEPEPPHSRPASAIIVKDEEENHEPTEPFPTLSSIWAAALAALASTNPAPIPTPSFPATGPPCLQCHRPSTFGRVAAGNPNGNTHRPYYRCAPCDAFTTWADLRGVRPGNRLCDGCKRPSRECVTGRRASCGPGKKYWTCAEGRCGFFEWD